MSQQDISRLRRAASGIRARLLGIVLVATLPLVLLSLENFRLSLRHERQHVEAQASGLASTIAGLAERLLYQGKTLTVALAIDGLLSLERPPASCRARLNALDRLDERMPWLIEFADAEGWSHCSTASGLEPMNIADREHFIEARTKRTVVLGDVVAERREGEMVVPITAPILDDQGQFRGVVRVGMPIDWILSYVRSAVGDAEMVILIHDRAGTLLAQAPSTTEPRRLPSGLWSRAGHESTAEAVDLGSYVVAFAPIMSGLLHVTVAIDQSTSAVEQQRIQLRNVAISVLVLLCGLTLAWLFAKRAIVTRLETLSRYGERLGEGDLSATVSGFDTTDEFGRLALGLSKMARRLRARIDDLADREAEARHAADHDPLTGIINRRAFDSLLEARLHRGSPTNSAMALFLIDLDYFKPVNDTHGHQQGDNLLRTMVDRMREIVRRDDVLARLGGDEFAILAALTDDRAASALALRVVEGMATPVTLPDGNTVTIGASIGIAYFPRDARTPAELFRLADRALYEAKGRGRGRAVESPTLDVIAEVIVAA